METVVRDRKVVVIAESLQQKTTMLEVHRKILEKLRKALRKKRRGMLTYGVVLIYDKALPHTIT
jgi:hypothetical protein